METVLITRNCAFCNKEHSERYKLAEYKEFENGKLVQEAMLNEPVEKREFLISSICPTCQKRIFG